MVSTFGVVFDPDLGRFDWTKFRAMARLHKKTDESLQKYLWAFTAMCRRVCRLPPREGGEGLTLSLRLVLSHTHTGKHLHTVILSVSLSFMLSVTLGESSHFQ